MSSSLKACNILAEGAQQFVLQNHGLARNCTLTTLYPAVVQIQKMNVGNELENAITFDVSYMLGLLLQNYHL